MGVSGFQDFWVVGSRLYYQRDAVASVEQPLVDLGVIETANPTLAIEKLELKDSESGVRKLVDEQVIEIGESYEITCNNLNLNNLSLLFLSTAPQSFVQTEDKNIVSQYAHPGALVKLRDNDALATPLFSLSAIAGVYTGTVLSATITAMSASAKTITVTEDLSVAVAPGDSIIVESDDLDNIANSRSYTIASISGTGPTIITVNEAPAANETAITGSLLYEDAGTIYEQDTDWDVYSLERGIVRLIDGGAFAAAANLTFNSSLAPLSGKRLLHPQDLKGEVKGQAWIFFNRNDNARQTVREARVSIIPASSNLSADEFSSMVLTVTVISDILTSQPAGRMLQHFGALPTSA
jgi:hypothetical protein